MDIGIEIRGEVRGEGIIRDQHGNVKGRFEIRGEATEQEFKALQAQVNDNGSDTLDRGA